MPSCPLHIKLGLARLVYTSRFPCQKAHWYHPLCLPPAEVDILSRYGSVDGNPKSADVMSCVDASGLSSIHRDQVRWILTPEHKLSSVRNMQLSTEITEVGKLTQRRGSKRKRADDDEIHSWLCSSCLVICEAPLLGSLSCGGPTDDHRIQDKVLSRARQCAGPCEL